MLRIRGIIYDVGLEYWPGQPIRSIPKTTMASEFELIKDELGCNALGLHGSFNDRLLSAARTALEAGLEVWFFPRYINRGISETTRLLGQLAGGAERLRKEYGAVVLGVGDELTVNCADFFTGQNYVDRVRRLRCYISFKKMLPVMMGEGTPDWFFQFKDRQSELHMSIGEFGDKGQIAELGEIARGMGNYLKRFDERFMSFLSQLVEVGRKNFTGQITYSSGWWEEIDWTIFDMAGIGIYLDATNWFTYETTLVQLRKRFGKPVIVTEFGASTFRHAHMYGGGAWTIFEKFEVERSEREQAEHIGRQFEMFKRAGVDGCFLFVFVDVPEKIHTPKPRHYKEDGDRGGYGIMKILPDGQLKPKQAFYTLKNLYSSA
jgi:hypothetical protein